MTKKRIFKISVALAAVTAAARISASGVSAAEATSTMGEKKMQEKINAAEGRIAELNVKLDPRSGIRHTLKRKSTGNDVKLLQQFLRVYGAYPEGLVTGYFGPLTEEAVKRFQRRESIDPVGIAGPKTRKRILEISQQKIDEGARVASTTPEIAGAALSSAIAEDGSASSTAGSFASTTKNLYAVLSLKNADQDSEISYIRYRNGNYVDSGVSHPSRTGLAYFHFQWSLKDGKARMPGNYLLVFYIDGKKSKTVNYTVY